MDPAMFSMLMKKGLYPYSYVDSFDKFEEEIPGIEKFVNDLTEEAPSVEDYATLMTICEELDLQTLGDLHDHYVKTDVLLLADVLTGYRRMGIDEYGLDPLHYATAPAFSYDAMLKMTKAEPELLHDIDMYMFLESGIRGGVSTIPHRLVVDEPDSKAWYTDCNNLYGYVMSFLLPYSNFEWYKKDEIKPINTEWIMKFDADGEVGLILKVNLKYPQGKHDEHRDYPLAPENLLITEEMLSPHAKECLGHAGWSSGSKTPKFTATRRLTPNLFDKVEYIVHIKNLQLYLDLGMELGTVHQVLSFKQKAWLKPYIDFNTEKRKAALSDFEKDFFKLLINAIFGKMMENVRRYLTVRMISEGRQHRLYTSKPQFKRFQIISEELVAAEMERVEVKLNKAIYAGFSILELSKHTMYDFHYNTVKRLHPDAVMCFTDTDSLLYKIPTDNLERELDGMKEYLDFSNYPEQHALYDTSNKKTPGFFKDECGGITINGFFGLRAKSYSIELKDAFDQPKPLVTIQKVMGVGEDRKLATAGLRRTTHKVLPHVKFLETLMEKVPSNVKQKTIRSKNHELETIETERVGLSALDIKRYVLEDGITTLPYGHYSIS